VSRENRVVGAQDGTNLEISILEARHFGLNTLRNLPGITGCRVRVGVQKHIRRIRKLDYMGAIACPDTGDGQKRRDHPGSQFLVPGSWNLVSRTFTLTFSRRRATSSRNSQVVMMAFSKR
jgi:hypothetical protein